MDVSSDLMSLHIGDRILEVNGTPVKDQPIENIENIIRYSDTVLQVYLTFQIFLTLTNLDKLVDSPEAFKCIIWVRFEVTGKNCGLYIFTMIRCTSQHFHSQGDFSVTTTFSTSVFEIFKAIWKTYYSFLFLFSYNLVYLQLQDRQDSYF